ncbi:MAG: CvpA family protein [Desulfovibrionaceae bacterium]
MFFDGIIIVVVLVVALMGAMNRLFVELLTFAGMVAGVYVCNHGFVISQFYATVVPNAPGNMAPNVYVGLLVALSLAAWFIAKVFGRILRIDFPLGFDRWGGALLGAGRGVCISAVLFYMLPFYIQVHALFSGSLLAKYVSHVSDMLLGL